MTLEDFSHYNGEGTELRKAQLRLLDMLIEFDRICTKHNIQYFLSGGSCLGAVRHGGFIPWDDDIDIDVWQSDYDKLTEVLPQELPGQYFMQTADTDKHFYRLYMKLVDKGSFVVHPDGNKVRQAVENKGLSIDILPLKTVASYRMKKIIERVYKPAFMILRTKQQTKKKIWLARILYPFARLAARVMPVVDKVASAEKVSHAYGTGMTPKLVYSQLYPVQRMLFEGRFFLVPAKPHEYLTGLYGDYMTIPETSARESHAASISVFEDAGNTSDIQVSTACKN